MFKLTIPAARPAHILSILCGVSHVQPKASVELGKGYKQETSKIFRMASSFCTALPLFFVWSVFFWRILSEVLCRLGDSLPHAAAWSSLWPLPCLVARNFEKEECRNRNNGVLQGFYWPLKKTHVPSNSGKDPTPSSRDRRFFVISPMTLEKWRLFAR